MGLLCWKNPFFFITNPLIAIDIDDQASFRLAEILYKERYILKKIQI